MKRSKIILSGSIICIAVGAVLLIGGMAAGGIPGAQITSKGITMGVAHTDDKAVMPELSQLTGEQKVAESFQSLEVTTTAGSVKLVKSDQAYVKWNLPSVEGYETLLPEIKVEDGCLKVVSEATEAQIDDSNASINLNWSALMAELTSDGENDYAYGTLDNWIEIGLPDTAYENIVVTSDDGDADISGISANSSKVNVLYGSVTMKDAGIADIFAQTSSGDIDVENCTGKNVELQTAYGGIEISDGSAEKITVSSESGDIDVSDIKQLTQADLTTQYGSIDFETKDKKDAYTFDLKTDYGSIEVFGEYIEAQSYKNGNGSCTINASAASGDITIEND